MAGSLDLTLPEPPASKRGGRLLTWLTFLGVLAILAHLGYDRLAAVDEAAGEGADLTSERLATLARTLEKRTLYAPAAEVWREYLAIAELPDDELGEVIYRRGRCLQEAGDPGGAARCYSEVQELPITREDKRRARQQLLECLSALGKEAAREHVARTFAAPESNSPGGEASGGAQAETGDVLALVGGEPVTREDLRGGFIDEVVDSMKAQGAPVAPAELRARAAAIVDERLRDAEFARQLLQQKIASEVLYREGLSEGYERDQELLRRVDRFRRSSIGSRVVEVEVARAAAAIGETDIANHYQAHLDRFVERSAVEFSFARFGAEGEAAAALTKLRAGDAGAVVWTAGTAAAVQGGPVPGVGQSAEVSAHLDALAEGEVSDRPIPHDGAFWVFRAESKRPSRQLTLEEARALVQADLLTARRQETLARLEAQLRAKYFVELREPDPAASEGPGPGPGPGTGNEP